MQYLQIEHSGFFCHGVVCTSRAYLPNLYHKWLLKPELHSSKLTFAGNIATHALAYVEAIGFSVVAAQKGFTVAEEAISFGELIDMSTPDQHHGYLAGMLDLAKEGHRNAAKTLETFRDVRKNVLAVGRLLFCSSSSSQFSPALGESET